MQYAADEAEMFYDDLADHYHLLFDDWAAALERQGLYLSGLIEDFWPGSRRVLDLACGIGTQSIALAQSDYAVTASDISALSVARARAEAAARDCDIGFSVCDMRRTAAHHGGGHDVVLALDNALCHLPSDEAIVAALAQMRRCLRPGGGCMVSLPDFDRLKVRRSLLRAAPLRVAAGMRCISFQTWEWENGGCQATVALLFENLGTGDWATHVQRIPLHVVSPRHAIELMREAGLRDVQQLEDLAEQPLLAGSAPADD